MPTWDNSLTNTQIIYTSADAVAWSLLFSQTTSTRTSTSCSSIAQYIIGATSSTTSPWQWEITGPQLPARLHRRPRQAASARARRLLLGELDPVQRALFETEGHFVHIGRRGVRYRIRPDVTANIDVLPEGRDRVLHRLCVHPAGAHAMPVEDIMLAQLLHLRADEAALLSIANHHPAI